MKQKYYIDTSVFGGYFDIEFEDILNLDILSKSESLNYQVLSENKIRFDLHTENNDFQQILRIVSAMNLKIKNFSIKGLWPGFALASV